MNLITAHLLEDQEVRILGQTGKVLGPVLYGHWTGKVLGQSVHLGKNLQIHFRDPPSMFETMAVQNLRKPADWLFKVKCWHGVILNLAQNGLWPVATNIFKEEQKVASYWPNTYECLVCPYLYLCIWGSCLYLCICLCFCVWLYCLYLCVWVSCLVWFVCSTLCMVVSIFVSGFLLFIFVSGCLVWSGCSTLGRDRMDRSHS